MNRAQIEAIENALLEALDFLLVHEPEAGPGTVYDKVIDDLRSALTLLRVWKSMVRASTGDTTSPGVLPGQLAIPGTGPETK